MWALDLAAAEKTLGSLSLVAAADVWLAGKISKCLLPKTIECCQGQIHALTKFFGDMPLVDFHAGSLKAYQMARTQGAGVFEQNGPAGASCVNHELNALQQILRRAGLWTPIADYYAPLREPDWKPPKTFSTREEETLFTSASLDPNVELADIVFRITRNTTASGCELRGLRLRNVELYADPPRIHIPPDATKNSVRPRTIPLNAEAREAFERAVDRAHRLGSNQPYHYLFPFRVNRAFWNPNRPASRSWLRKQTKKLRDSTGIEHLRPHAFRHLAVTEMLENGANEHAVIAVAGWVSRKMLDYYSHHRIEAKLEAVQMLDRKKPPQPAPDGRGNLIPFPGRKSR
jgi:integrase